MGTRPTSLGLLLIALACLFCAVSPPAHATRFSKPFISSIEILGDVVVVKAQAPSGYKKITLESRRHMASSEGWQPKAVHHSEGRGGQVIFQIPFSQDLEMLRVRADLQDLIPLSFFQGANSFRSSASYSSPPVTVVVTAPAPPPPTMPTMDGAGSVANTTPVVVNPRPIVESDIWKLRGDTLFFFNQGYGLQILDVADPANPVLMSCLPITGAGEQMYVYAHGYAILQTGGDCASSTSDRILVIDALDRSKPAIRSTIGIPGDIKETRLSGNILYVVSQQYQVVTNNNAQVWQAVVKVNAINLADPLNPVNLPGFSFAGSLSAASAGNNYLFVAVGSPSEVHCIDISDEGGAMRLTGTAKTAGRVLDKFKVNYDNLGVLTVISYVNHTWPNLTALETFRLAPETAPQKLGSLTLATNEQLYATRFASERVYIVTYRRIDPLWIVDLSNPAAPAIRGELHVPGWSTYIQPWGPDRLIAMGIDDVGGRRAAVSLFDVADVRKPALLSKVSMGQGWSESEANQDEKAFGFFPEESLILAPYSGQTTNGYKRAVQLITFDRNTLLKRGEISHEFLPRRATLHKKHILSVSARELLSVNAAALDAPELRARLKLTWNISRLTSVGDFIIELDLSAQQPALQVVSKAEPYRVLGSLGLTNGYNVMGWTTRGSHLLLAQFDLQRRYAQAHTNKSELLTTIVDLSALPLLRVLNQSSAEINMESGGQMEAVWMQPDLLVWFPVRQSTSVLQPWTLRPPEITVPLPPVVPAIEIPISLPVGAPENNVTIAAPSPQVAAQVISPGIGVVGTGQHIESAVILSYGGSQRPIYIFDAREALRPALVAESTVPSDTMNYSLPFQTASELYYSRLMSIQKIIATNYYVQTLWQPRTVTNVFLQTNTFWLSVTNYQTNVVEVPGQYRDTVVESAQQRVTITNRVQRSTLGWLENYATSLPSLSAAGYRSLLLDHEGFVHGWGGNLFGELTVVGSSIAPALVKLNGLPRIQHVSSGGVHSLALDREGGIWVWGADSAGQLGIGGLTGPSEEPWVPNVQHEIPIKLGGLPSVRALFAGLFNSFAVGKDGSVWGWGDNTAGQVGDGARTNQVWPVRLDLPEPLLMSGGRRHSLAYMADGSLWLWGDNSYKQLAVEGLNSRFTPEKLTTSFDLKAIVSGFNHVLALNADGQVLAWGANAEGQLGRGHNSFAELMEPVRPLTNIVGIAAGANHSLALSQDGSVWAWGDNRAGQIGLSNQVSSATPERIVLPEKAASIAAGAVHSVVLTESGKLHLFGDGSYGQLGLTNTESYTYATNEVLVTNFVWRTEISLRTNITRVVTPVPSNSVVWATNVVTTWEEEKRTNAYPVTAYEYRHMLHVIDFVNPTVPVFRKGVNIPGELIGLSHQGTLIYTRGVPEGTNAVEQVQASAFDGVSAFLVAALPISTHGSSHTASLNEVLYLSQNQTTNSPALLQSWRLSTTGQFELIGQVALPSNLVALKAKDQTLLANGADGLMLFDANLVQRGAFDLPACRSYSLSELAGDRASGFWIALDGFHLQRIPFQ